MKQVIKSANARWDTESNPKNPGWVVDIERLDGTKDTLSPAPSVYHYSDLYDPEIIVQATLKYEGLTIQAA